MEKRKREQKNGIVSNEQRQMGPTMRLQAHTHTQTRDLEELFHLPVHGDGNHCVDGRAHGDALQVRDRFAHE